MLWRAKDHKRHGKRPLEVLWSDSIADGGCVQDAAREIGQPVINCYFCIGNLRLLL